MKSFFLLYLLFLGVFVSLQVRAESLAPPFTIRMGSGPQGALLIAQPPAGHHFNVDAPVKLHMNGVASGDLRPVRAELHEVDFDIAQAGAIDGGVISIFLCDDAGKFCEKHEQRATWKQGGQVSQGTLQPGSEHGAGSGHEIFKLDEHGFYDNQFALALSEAKKKGALLLIDFYGIWCPPCNELNDLVFNKHEFKKASQNFVKLKLDVDSPATDELSQRYKIIGFPTVIIADPEGSELTRIVGYRPLHDFVAVMDEVWRGFKQPSKKGSWVITRDLEKRAQAGDREALDRLGIYYFNNSENEKAAEYLKGTRVELEKLTEAKIALLEEKEKNGDKVARSSRKELLKNSILLFPNSPESLDRLEGLAQLAEEDKNETEAKKFRLNLVALAQKILKHPEWLKGYDADLGGLWTTLAEGQAALGDATGASEAWKNAIAQYELKIIEGDVRGGNLELAYCLRKSGRTAEAMALYEKMEKAYPNEFTFYFGHARALLALKQPKEALHLAQTALEHSYGMNRLNSAELLAKIHSELNEKDLAKKVIQEALSGVQVGATSAAGFQSRFQKKVQQLNEFAQRI